MKVNTTIGGKHSTNGGEKQKTTIEGKQPLISLPSKVVAGSIKEEEK